MVLLAKFNTSLYSCLNATKLNCKKKKENKSKSTIHTQQFVQIRPKHPRDFFKLRFVLNIYVFIYLNIVMTAVQRESGYKS